MSKYSICLIYQILDDLVLYGNKLNVRPMYANACTCATTLCLNVKMFWKNTCSTTLTLIYMIGILYLFNSNSLSDIISYIDWKWLLTLLCLKMTLVKYSYDFILGSRKSIFYELNLFYICIFISIWPGPHSANEPSNPEYKEFDELILGFMKEHSIPGISLVISKKGTVRYTQCM